MAQLRSVEFGFRCIAQAGEKPPSMSSKCRLTRVIQSVGQERGQPCPQEPDSATERADMAVRAPISRDGDRRFESHPRFTRRSSDVPPPGNVSILLEHTRSSYPGGQAR